MKCRESENFQNPTNPMNTAFPIHQSETFHELEKKYGKSLAVHAMSPKCIEARKNRKRILATAAQKEVHICADACKQMILRLKAQEKFEQTEHMFSLRHKTRNIIRSRSMPQLQRTKEL